MIILREPVEFEWDVGNKDKNIEKHNVSNEECEEVFFDQEKRILQDPIHSIREHRYIIIGKTKEERLLFIVFTQRKQKVRIISARDLNKKETHLYEKEA